MKIYFNFNDWWIGYYRGSNKHFICPLPTLVIEWNRKKKPPLLPKVPIITRKDAENFSEMIANSPETQELIKKLTNKEQWDDE